MEMFGSGLDWKANYPEGDVSERTGLGLESGGWFLAPMGRSANSGNPSVPVTNLGFRVGIRKGLDGATALLGLIGVGLSQKQNEI